jgi:release factor glutamine methyltransferase
LKVREASRLARERLSVTGHSQPAEDALYILEIVLEVSRLDVLANQGANLSPRQQKTFEELLLLREAHFPLQYMSGRQDFYGRDFKVTPSVLIPRPETEILVEVGLHAIKPLLKRPIRVLDVGTGSGCIAVTIACENTFSRVVALDPSPEALRIARQNSLLHNCNNRVDLVCGYLKDLPHRQFDLVISNPPYLGSANTANVQPGVLEFEPRKALLAGQSGLTVYQEIFEYSKNLIAPSAPLIVELSFDNLNDVSSLASSHGWKIKSVHKDLAGWQRVALFQVRT